MPPTPLSCGEFQEPTCPAVPRVDRVRELRSAPHEMPAGCYPPAWGTVHSCVRLAWRPRFPICSGCSHTSDIPPFLAQDQARLSEDGCCLLCPQPQPQNREWPWPCPWGRGRPWERLADADLCTASHAPPRVHVRCLLPAAGHPATGLQLRGARAPCILPGQLWRHHLHVREPQGWPARMLCRVPLAWCGRARVGQGGEVAEGAGPAGVLRWAETQGLVLFAVMLFCLLRPRTH